MIIFFQELCFEPKTNLKVYNSTTTENAQRRDIVVDEFDEQEAMSALLNSLPKQTETTTTDDCKIYPNDGNYVQKSDTEFSLSDGIINVRKLEGINVKKSETEISLSDETNIKKLMEINISNDFEKIDIKSANQNVPPSLNNAATSQMAGVKYEPHKNPCRGNCT